ncbi:hypothetical protein CR513_14849, partial [Mucuna pruriens]
MVNVIGAVDNLRLENQLTELTSLVRQLAVGQHQPSIAARVCGICTSMEHPIDMYPTLQETESDHLESVGAIGAVAIRAVCNSAIQTRLNVPQGQPGDSIILGATIPTIVTTKSVSSRRLTIFGGPDEALAGSSNLPSQTILNPRGNASTLLRPTNADSELDANSQLPRPKKSIPLPFPTRTLSAKKPESDEELLKMF